MPHYAFSDIFLNVVYNIVVCECKRVFKYQSATTGVIASQKKEPILKCLKHVVVNLHVSTHLHNALHWLPANNVCLGPPSNTVAVHVVSMSRRHCFLQKQNALTCSPKGWGCEESVVKMNFTVTQYNSNLSLCSKTIILWKLLKKNL